MHITDVILWWHHHQPWYLDPVTGHARLPWVRLHACRGYLDMAAAAEHSTADGVIHTFNFVPSLLDQLEHYAQPDHSDLWLDLSRPHPRDLDEQQRTELIRRMGGGGPTPTRPLPRLDELREKVSRQEKLSDHDVLDLQVLAHLGFMGSTLAHRPGVVRELLEKGKDFTQDEKLALLQATREVCAEVLPRYRKLQEAGRVELTATPYFHPILPLVVDTSAMADGLPGHAQPPPFRFPEDARYHVTAAQDRFQQVFGKKPVGMWPAEGSVSAAALGILAEAGVRYCGTDEQVLRRSEVADEGAVHHHEAYLDPSGKVAMFFRDHAASDQIGFSYRYKTPEAAAHDLVGRARSAGHGMGGRVMVVILDGENPWEHYANAGREHLRAIQHAFTHARDVRVVGPSRFLEKHPPRRRISRLHAGSWIDGTFAIWIGHAEDRHGWRLLGDCRRAIERARRQGAPTEQVEAALRKLYPAEGSDWFWWFGEEFHAREADLYDELFRGQIKAAYVALGEKPPAELDRPVRHARHVGAPGRRMGWLQAPWLTGGTPSAMTWHDAVRVRPGEAGAMAMATSTGPMGELLVGCDERALWFCALFPDKTVPRGTLSLHVTQRAEEHVVQVELPSGKVHAEHPRRQGKPLADVGEVVMVQWPLAGASLQGGERCEIHAVLQVEGGGSQRLPASGAAEVELPDAELRWRAAWC
ncbi:MAG: glycoside hydrolase family 57 protein [Myxococcota bacterium]